MSNYYKHPSSIIETDNIGADTRIWAFVHILDNVVIGNNCNICDHCYIEGGVIIGNNVTIKCGIYIWDGVEVGDDVFLGPNVVFTNDLRPRSKQYVSSVKTKILKGASLGANSTVLAGVTIGKYAMSGIGSVITRNVPDHALVYGNPAKIRGWVDEKGLKLAPGKNNEWISEDGNIYLLQNGIINKI
jgi:acetyltransferase-like isoleucine patch superfamily enzyme